MARKRPPVPKGYEPTAFAPVGSTVELSVGGERMGEVAEYAHRKKKVKPHMAIRRVEEEVKGR